MELFKKVILHLLMVILGFLIGTFFLIGITILIYIL